MRDIVCVSTNYWDGEWFRKQQFVSRFARDGHRVLYVNPSHSIVRRDRRPYVKNGLITHLAEDGGVYVLTPRLQIPFVSRPWSETINAELLFGEISVALRKLQFTNPLVLVYPVAFVPQARRLTDGHVVLDLVDDYEGYDDREWRKTHVRRSVMTAVRAADRVVYTSGSLQAKYPSGGPSIVIPNGYDETIFRPGREVAEEIRGLERVVGFVGTLFRYIDFELLNRVADAVPDAHLVLVGRIEEPKCPSLERLLRRPNVRWMQYVPRWRVPEFIAGFDVALVPFCDGLVTDSVSPVKAYEYLAMGVPVVSTALPALEADPVCGHIQFTGSGDEFVDAVRRCLTQRPKIPAVASAASWEARYNALKEFLRPSLIDV